MGRSFRVALGSGVACIGGLVASCALGLDESLIGRSLDAGAVLDANVADAAPTDGRSDAGLGDRDASASCTSDDACKATHGCLTGKCDLTRKSCVYDVCRTSACNASACDTAKAVCGAPTPYKYKASQFSLGQPISCVGCAVAIYPWLFALTPTGTVAFNVSTAAGATPPQVPIVGLGFVPSQIVGSGNRVWLLGSPSGASPSRVPIAYVDAPVDPFASKIVANTVLASYNRPATEAVTLFQHSSDSALFVGPIGAQYPSVVVQAPLVEPVSLTATPLPFSTTATPVTVSGTRLLTGTIVNQIATFQFIEKIGGAAPVNGPATSMTSVGAVGAIRFASSSDGAVFWAAGVQQGTGGTASTKAARGYFLVANETAPIDGSIGADVEIYDAPGPPVAANAAVLGPLAMLDAKTVMISAQARESSSQTSVQFMKRDPLGVIKEITGTSRRQVLPIPVNSFVAATASNGIGYLVANDPPGSSTVYVFDPACTP